MTDDEKKAHYRTCLEHLRNNRNRAHWLAVADADLQNAEIVREFDPILAKHIEQHAQALKNVFAQVIAN